MIDPLNARGVLRNLLVVSHYEAEPNDHELSFIKKITTTLGLDEKDLAEVILEEGFFIPEDINDRIRHLIVVMMMLDTIPGEELPDEKLDAIYGFSRALGFSKEDFINISNNFEMNKDNIEL